MTRDTRHGTQDTVYEQYTTGTTLILHTGGFSVSHHTHHTHTSESKRATARGQHTKRHTTRQVETDTQLQDERDREERRRQEKRREEKTRRKRREEKRREEKRREEKRREEKRREEKRREEKRREEKRREEKRREERYDVLCVWLRGFDFSCFFDFKITRHLE